MCLCWGIFRIFKPIPTKGKRWDIRWWCTKDFCLRCIDNKAGTEVCLRDDMKATLMFNSSKAWLGSIIGVPKGRNQRRLSFFGIGDAALWRDHNRDDTQLTTVWDGWRYRWDTRAIATRNRLKIIGARTHPCFLPHQYECWRTENQPWQLEHTYRYGIVVVWRQILEGSQICVESSKACVGWLYRMPLLDQWRPCICLDATHYIFPTKKCREH